MSKITFCPLQLASFLITDQIFGRLESHERKKQDLEIKKTLDKSTLGFFVGKMRLARPALCRASWTVVEHDYSHLQNSLCLQCLV